MKKAASFASTAAATSSPPTRASSNLTILLHVQSCRGIGHLHRVGAIAAGLAAKHRVVVVSGGPRVEGFADRFAREAGKAAEAAGKVGGADFRFVQLPPVAAATGSQSWKLVACDTGLLLDSALKAKRCALLLSVLREEKPAAVVIEMFPFGRRRFHFELEPLLDACYEMLDADGTEGDGGGGGSGGGSGGGGGGGGGGRDRYRPALISSVRDVLVKRSTSEYEWAARKIRSHFDAVLVHGSKAMIPFAATFPLTSKIEEKLVYTGYVVREAPCLPQNHRDDQGRTHVLVSSGGGGSGNVERFYTAALE